MAQTYSVEHGVGGYVQRDGFGLVTRLGYLQCIVAFWYDKLVFRKACFFFKPIIVLYGGGAISLNYSFGQTVAHCKLYGVDISLVNVGNKII